MLNLFKQRAASIDVDLASSLTHFSPMFHFMPPLKASENLYFSEVFVAYESGTLV